MKIEKNQVANQLVLAISGRLDTATAPQLEAVVANELTGSEAVVIDCKELEYVSSAGLRVLLATQKVMNRQGSMLIRNVNEGIMEIFEITGFIDILTIE